MRVASTPGKGSIFSVLLPVYRDVNQKSAVHGGKKLRILLVGDNADLRHRYAQVFANSDFEIVGESDNGQDGVAIYRQMQPDITIYDVDMPSLDGIRALKEILGINPDACIIMLSYMSSNTITDISLRTGIKYYLRKDTPHSEILNRVRNIWTSYEKSG